MAHDDPASDPPGGSKPSSSHTRSINFRALSRSSAGEAPEGCVAAAPADSEDGPGSASRSKYTAAARSCARPWRSLMLSAIRYATARDNTSSSAATAAVCSSFITSSIGAFDKSDVERVGRPLSSGGSTLLAGGARPAPFPESAPPDQQTRRAEGARRGLRCSALHPIRATVSCARPQASCEAFPPLTGRRPSPGRRPFCVSTRPRASIGQDVARGPVSHLRPTCLLQVHSRCSQRTTGRFADVQKVFAGSANVDC